MENILSRQRIFLITYVSIDGNKGEGVAYIQMRRGARRQREYEADFGLLLLGFRFLRISWLELRLNSCFQIVTLFDEFKSGWSAARLQGPATQV
jgi:hypothetical protein